MSKPDLLTNIKFRRLLKATGLPRPLLVGHLEMLWTTAHVGKPVFLDAEDVELAADWDGDSGVFAANLIKYGFVDETDGGLVIHDYWDHAPEYVKRRERRRRKKEAMSVADRPLTDTASSKVQPTSQTHTTSVPVRDTSVAVREPSEPPSTATRTSPDQSANSGKTSEPLPPRDSAALLAKIKTLTNEKIWHLWWQDVLNRLERANPDLQPLWDAVAHVESRLDPAKGATTRQGPLKDPMAYLAKEAITLGERRRASCPRVPRSILTG